VGGGELQCGQAAEGLTRQVCPLHAEDRQQVAQVLDVVPDVEVVAWRTPASRPQIRHLCMVMYALVSSRHTSIGGTMSERIWDTYLTEQDRAHSLLQPPVNRGLGARPVLLLIDIYRSAFGDVAEPLLDAIKTWPGSCGVAAWESLPHIQLLLSKARELKIPVVHVTGLAELPSWREQRLTDGRGAGREQRAEQYAIMESVAPVDGEVVLHKAAPSAFWGTPLAGYLHQLGADSLIVAGETTSGCVRATVVDACSYRYKVAVVEECVFDRTEAAHAINLFDMAHKYADVVALSDLLATLQAKKSDER
jgi:maleamate amidohydrolase